ncbi:hypothetical protein [Aliagarivorans marinus]|uniref:hypothetical protein n=1 Tax=Aliagarivorans marinus TaxID=561965 RepID=UPI000478FFBB|nr:hypothetical protein [Aliagarivorans marinus]
MDTKITVAFIAGMCSFIGLVITKEHKVSEFRQLWIDRVRDDISDLMAGINKLGFSWDIKSHSETVNNELLKDFVKENLETFNEIDVAISRIKLSLNPDKDADLIDVLNKLTEASNPPTDLKAMETSIDSIEELSHQMFKVEWERVKKGEWFYRCTKYLAAASVVALGVFFATKI